MPPIAILASMSLAIALGSAPAVSAGSAEAGAISEAMNQAAVARMAVSEIFVATGRWPNDNTEAGYEPAPGPAAVSVGRVGVIHVTLASDEQASTGTITLTPSSTDSGDIAWSCRAKGIADELLPVPCRK